MYQLVVKGQFSAAHRLVQYPGACARIHGHNWKVKATMAGDKLDALGMVFDMMALQSILQECLDQFDHHMINEVAPFDQLNPSSENLAHFIYHWMKKRLPEPVQIVQVEVAENDEFSVAYSETNC